MLRRPARIRLGVRRIGRQGCVSQLLPQMRHRGCARVARSDKGLVPKDTSRTRRTSCTGYATNSSDCGRTPAPDGKVVCRHGFELYLSPVAEATCSTKLLDTRSQPHRATLGAESGQDDEACNMANGSVTCRFLASTSWSADLGACNYADRLSMYGRSRICRDYYAAATTKHLRSRCIALRSPPGASCVSGTCYVLP